MSDDLIAHYAGFTIKVALTMHRRGDRWTAAFTLIQDRGEKSLTVHTTGSTAFATREEAKQAALNAQEPKSTVRSLDSLRPARQRSPAFVPPHTRTLSDLSILN